METGSLQVACFSMIGLRFRPAVDLILLGPALSLFEILSFRLWQKIRHLTGSRAKKRQPDCSIPHRIGGKIARLFHWPIRISHNNSLS
jgi:hypothetical protein